MATSAADRTESLAWDDRFIPLTADFCCPEPPPRSRLHLWLAGGVAALLALFASHALGGDIDRPARDADARATRGGPTPGSAARVAPSPGWRQTGRRRQISRARPATRRKPNRRRASRPQRQRPLGHLHPTEARRRPIAAAPTPTSQPTPAPPPPVTPTPPVDGVSAPAAQPTGLEGEFF